MSKALLKYIIEKFLNLKNILNLAYGCMTFELIKLSEFDTL